jgi:hypothetical protein
MPRNIDENRTEFFTVVGAPYVQEHHADDRSHYREYADRNPPETGVAGLWLVFYAVIIGASLFSHGGASKAFHVASALLK